jgi:hypothetical protein
VVDDTTPQLGGNLDVNAKAINFGDSNGTTTNMLTFGVGSDLKLYHDSATNKSHITETGSSHLVIQGQEIQFKNASGTSLLDMNSAQVELKFNGSKKMETETNGVTVTGNVTVSGTVDGRDIATNIPASLGTAGQVLTVNSGASAGEWADAGGGGGSPDLYADSANGSAVTPTANAGGSYNSVAIGNGADIGSGRGDSIAIGTDALANQSQALAIGRSATVNSSGTWGTAVGRNSVVNGQSAVALGNSYSSGTDSFAAVIDNNTSSYGAKATSSIALGYTAEADSSYSAALGGNSVRANASYSTAVGGLDNYVSGTRSITAGGQGNAVTGTYASVIGGRFNRAPGEYSSSSGYYANAVTYGKEARANGNFGGLSSPGDSQRGLVVLRSDTTDATAEVLTANNSTASADNQVILPNNSAYFFSGTLIAREQASAGTDVGAWEIKGAIRREANAASTVLIKSTIDDFNVPTGWAVALTADTTNGGLAITVTGAAATNIRWVGSVTTSEVTY